jgi:MoaA/NifB/PqqE/SkfB family radical SAM enzyme
MKTIIEMAREAGIDWHRHWNDDESNRLEAFADLIRANEREAWEHKYARLQGLMEIRETQPNKPCCLAEREACAKVCDAWDEWAGTQGIFAKAIRARGNT